MSPLEPTTDDTGGLRCSLVLASRFGNIEVAEHAFAEFGRLTGVADEDRYWVVSALREALANAVRHGNLQDPTRRVGVEYLFDGAAFTISVSDQGEGFDLGAIPDPTDPANVLRPSGRGIFYMRQFMDRVHFEISATGGTTVVMTRRVRPTQGSGSDEEQDP